jgi:hypothetical protein
MTKKLRRLVPRLFGNQYRISSAKTKRYNCIAWAAGKTKRWWEAPPNGYWPASVLADGSVESAVQLFEFLGYQRCANDASLDEGFTKVAVFGDADGYTHAARQLPDGRWSSKIGKLQDIEHDTLDGLTGSDYGSVVQMLKKPVAGP